MLLMAAASASSDDTKSDGVARCHASQEEKDDGRDACPTTSAMNAAAS
jgi:hypothetical protein